MRGLLLKQKLYLLPNTIRILDNVVRPEADNAPSLALHHGGTPGISFLLKGMVLAVDFDHELARDAGEVREISTDWMLPPKFGVGDPAITQGLPHFAFCSAAIATQFACSLAIVIVAGHDPLTQPLRQGGGGRGEEHEIGVWR